MTTLTSPLATSKGDISDSSGPADRKKDKRFIRLQVIESEIKEFNILRYYLFVMMVSLTAFLSFSSLFQFPKLTSQCAITGKFFVDVVDVIRDTGEDTYLDLALRVIQILGYGYGFQAHTSKNYAQSLILLYYIILSYTLIAFYTYQSAIDNNMYSLAFDIANIFVNLILTRSVYKFCKVLKGTENLLKIIFLERDRLKRELAEAKAKGEIV